MEPIIYLRYNLIELNFYLGAQFYRWWKLCHSELRVKSVIYLFIFWVTYDLGGGVGSGQRLVPGHQGMGRLWPWVVTCSFWHCSSMMFSLLSDHRHPSHWQLWRHSQSELVVTGLQSAPVILYLSRPSCEATSGPSDLSLSWVSLNDKGKHIYPKS